MKNRNLTILVFSLAIIIAVSSSANSAPPVFIISNALVNGQPTSYSIHNGGLVSFAAYDHFEFDYNVMDPDGDPFVSYELSPSTSFSPPPPWGVGPLAGINFAPALPVSCNCNQLNHFETTPEIAFVGVLIIKATDSNGEFSLLILYFDWALPVDLTSFVSAVYKNTVKLDWTTSSEANNSRFEIERSNANETRWITAGTVAGSGNSTQPVSYSYIDRGLQCGKYSYRLKQIDYNGNYRYYDLSNEVEISAVSDFELSQNYPNPFNPSTKIEFRIPEDGLVSLLVFDNNGREVSRLVDGFKTAGYYNVEFNGGSLSSGIYYCKLHLKSKSVTTERVMKMTLVK